MNVLVLGGGGREHAIVWALSNSSSAGKIHAAPGNPGIAKLGTIHNIDPTSSSEVVTLARKEQIDLVVIGPEAPLVSGVADALREEGIATFGPGRDGARLEGSKAYSKTFMARHGIPTAPFDICNTLDEAKAAINKRTAPFVVKADGLAAGKGAFLLDSPEEALSVAESLLAGELGDAGRQIIIEDYINGVELTVLAVTDGKTIRLLPSSQDHKRAYDGDRGPNTGGMGAYAPVPWATDELLEEIKRDILIPTVNGLIQDGIDYCGIIYAGIMLDEKMSPHVLEYNVRLGDPETQAVLPLFNGDWAAVCLACAEGRLEEIEWPTVTRSAIGVVMASGGYPEKYETGFPISGIDELSGEEDILVFQAGTSLDKQAGLVTDGGRVLCVVALGKDIEEASQRVYGAIKKVSFTGVHYRQDIAAKAIL